MTRRSPEGRDWDKIEADFLAQDRPDLLTCTERTGVPYSTIMKRSADYKWMDKWKAIRREAEERNKERLTNEVADKISSQNEVDLRASDSLREKALSMLDFAERPSEVAAIANALDKAQKIARLALGMSTDNNLVDTVRPMTMAELWGEMNSGQDVTKSES